MNNCPHYTYSVQQTSKYHSPNGEQVIQTKKTCSECKLTWTDVDRESDNITTQEYINHLREGNHSDNSPHMKILVEDNYIPSGQQRPDYHIEWIKCQMCRKYSEQNRHEVE